MIIATAPSANEQAGAKKPERDLSRANMEVQRRLERLRRRPRPAQPDQRRDLQAERRHDRHGVGVREPLHAAAADEHHEHRRGHGDVDGPGWRAEPRVQERQALGNGALDRQPLQLLLGVASWRGSPPAAGAAPRPRRARAP